MNAKLRRYRSVFMLGVCCLVGAPQGRAANSDIELNRGPIDLHPPEPDLRRDATVNAIEQVMPSVVNIATKNVVRLRDPIEEAFRQFWDPYYSRQNVDQPYSLGSGVMIDDAGYLLTNDHVVR